MKPREEDYCGTDISGAGKVGQPSMQLTSSSTELTQH